MRYALPLLAALFACGPSMNDIPTGSCNAPDYQRLPASEVGGIVTWERIEELDRTAEQIRIALGLAGYPIERLRIAEDVQMYRMRYVTQDRGEAVEATALVSFPVRAGDYPTVAYTHGTTGFTNACAPSADGLEGAAPNLILSSLGNVVVAPDYLGMNGFGAPSDLLHPYVIAEPTAIAVLDSIRALWRHAETDDTLPSKPTTRTVFFGGSEGGFAALWSDRYAPYYLPDAELVATVASVPPTDLLGLAERGATVASPTTLAMAAAIVSHQDWYHLDFDLKDIFLPDIADMLPPLLRTDCSPDVDETLGVDDIFTPSFIEAATTRDTDAMGDLGCTLIENSLATATFPRAHNTPTFYVISGEDNLVYSGTNHDDVPRLCEQGYAMQVIECEGASHTEGALLSIHLQWAFAQARLDGEELTATCELPTPIQCDETEKL